jgi:uncharacterized protein (TIGR00369 family)
VTDRSADALSGPRGIHSTLDISVVEASNTKVVLRLNVGPHVHQPYGILHGGVSALMAESAASFGGALAAPEGKGVVGIELNASHLRAVSDGPVTATATPLRVGRTVQVWGIEVRDQDDRLTCVARCTLAVVDRPPTVGS